MMLPQDLLNCLSNKYQELILFPTEQCNFRCVYCYENFISNSMCPETMQGIKNFITKRAENLEILHIQWFGGEPLLEKNIITDISKHILKTLNEYPNLHYESSMTTNGYLLSKNIFEEMISLGINTFQISLDGSKQIHNKTRIKLDGNGTFDQIWSNLMAIKNTTKNFIVILRIHLTGNNLSTINELMRNIQDAFKNDIRFRIFFKAIADLGGGNGNLTLLSKKQIRSFVQQIISKFENLYYIDFEGQSSYICYASRPNSLAIRANGTINKCTVALSDSKNVIGKIFANGTIKIDNIKLTPWIRGLENMDYDILRCPFSRMKT